MTSNAPHLGKAAWLAAAIAFVHLPAHSTDVYAGVGTSGAELGGSLTLGDRFALRAEGNVLSFPHTFTTSDIDYDSRYKATNAGTYVDLFVASGFRLTGGALIGSRKLHGTAVGANGTIKFNGVLYPIAPGDSLDFDAKYPTVTPYLGIGWGHHEQGSGFHFYVDAGVAYGKPKVTLSPSASLAAKITPADLSGEQSSVQDKADDYRYDPVVKLGVTYAF